MSQVRKRAEEFGARIARERERLQQPRLQVADMVHDLEQFLRSRPGSAVQGSALLNRAALMDSSEAGTEGTPMGSARGTPRGSDEGTVEEKLADVERQLAWKREQIREQRSLRERGVGVGGAGVGAVACVGGGVGAAMTAGGTGPRSGKVPLAGEKGGFSSSSSSGVSPREEERRSGGGSSSLLPAKMAEAEASPFGSDAEEGVAARKEVCGFLTLLVQSLHEHGRPRERCVKRCIII